VIMMRLLPLLLSAWRGFCSSLNLRRVWSLSQLDMMNAFLNGELDAYMRPPPEYSVPKGMVYHLRRSLYGLKQSPRA
jgi:hypothetical protein